MGVPSGRTGPELLHKELLLPRPPPCRRALGRLLGIAPLPVDAVGQSVLDRSPDLSGGWVAPSGVLQFDFVHRFTASPSPERKVTSFPTFVLGFGLPHRTMLGFTYSTNSTLVSRYPNEWELGAHALPVSQATGGALDLGVEAGYNLAVQGFVGEASAARRMGRLKLLAVARLLADPDGGDMDVALGGGTVVRLGRYVALAGDVTSVLQRNAATGRGNRVERRPAVGAPAHAAHPVAPGEQHHRHQSRVGVAGHRADALRVRIHHPDHACPLRRARRTDPGGHDRGRDQRRRGRSDDRGSYQEPGLRALAAITVPAGTTVEWVNDDPLAHTVVAADSSFDSGLIEPGKTWRHTFTKPGTFDYSCRPHPFMHGTVVVKAAP